MATKYPHQILSRLASAEEKEKAEALAEANGVSVSSLVRLLLIQAAREGWTVGVHRKSKAA